MTGVLSTFGYAGLRDADMLRARLGDAVNVVVDVRLNAYSGNRAFSLTTKRTVQDAGYGYFHIPDLGNAEHKTGGMRIRDIDAVEKVIDLLGQGLNVALMCACYAVDDCHRLVVANEIVARVPSVRLTIDAPRPDRVGEGS